MSRKSAALARDSELVRRAFARVDRRSGPVMRRGGRGAGGTRTDNDEKLYGLTSFGTSSYYQTDNPGGEPGTSGGFGFATLLRVDSLASVQRALAARYGGTSGWMMAITASNGVVAYAHNNTATSGSYIFTASDVGKIFLVTGIHNGSNQVQAWINRAFWSAGAQTGFTVTAAAHRLGLQSDGTFPGSGLTFLAHMDFQGVPNAAQMAALADTVRATGDLPATMAGATVTHRWSARDLLRGAVSYAGRVTYGARGFSATAGFQSATNPGGIAGVNTGFHVMWRGRADVLGPTQVFISRSNAANAGWRAGVSGTTVVATFTRGDAVQVNASAATPQQGRVHHYCLVHTGASNTIQLYQDGVQAGSDVACNGFTPLAARMFIGSLDGSAFAASGYTVFDVTGGHAVPTATEIRDSARASEAQGVLVGIPGKSTGGYWSVHQDVVANGGAMPAQITDRNGTDHLTRVGTVEVATDVGTAPAAPLAIVDSITGATADTMSRVGAPSVKVIDPSIDGRVTYGVQGFSTVSSIDGSASIAPGAAGGFWTCIVARPDATPAGVQMLMGTFDGLAKGWGVQLVPQLRFGIYDTGGLKTSSLYTIPAADIGQRKLYAFHFTGSQLRVYADGVQQGADVASGPVWQTDGPFRFGRNGASHPTLLTSIFGASYGAGNPTLAQIQQLFADFAANGRVPSIAGMTDFRVEFTDDVVANGGPANGVPATFANRAGAGTLTRGAGIEVRTHNGVSGLTLASADHYFSTAVGEGLRGSVSGFSGEALVYVPSPAPTAVATIAACLSTSLVGYYLYQQGSGIKLDTFLNASTFGSASMALAGADLDRWVHVAWVYTGAALRLYKDGVQQGSDVATTNFAVASTATPFRVMQSTANTASPLITGRLAGVSGGDGHVWSGAEVATASSAALAAGRVQGVAGKTTRRYDIAQDIADAGGAVPLNVRERQNSVDHMTRVGAPLQLAARAERVWSYEQSPILYGSRGFTANDYWETVTDGFMGVPYGFMVEALLTIDAQGASATRMIATRQTLGSNPGWNLFTSGTNSTLLFSVGGASSGANSSAAVISTSDLGKLLHVTGVWDAPAGRVRLYIKRAEVSTGGIFTNAYVPAASGKMRIGARAGDGVPATGITVYNFRAGNFVPTLAEVQSAHDRVIANERYLSTDYPGRALDCLYRFEETSPATISDLVGSAHLTRNGSPTAYAHHARSWGW